MIARAKVLASRRLTPTVHEIRTEKPPGFDFRPVQFCGLEIATSEGSEEYPMSLATSPTRDDLAFGSRITSGTPWKRAFAALAPGDEVEVDGPYGHFILDGARDALFLAGGIGITPLKGMAEYLADTRSPRRAILLYSNQTEEEIAYRDELDALQGANANFQVVHTLTREPEGSAWGGRRGRFDPRMVREASAALDDPVHYVCGTPGMVRDLLTMLSSLDVPAERIVYERFMGY